MAVFFCPIMPAIGKVALIFTAGVMRRFFVKNILFVIAVNVLVKPVWVLLIDRTVQNRVPAGEYGTYQALLSLSIIFQIILDFGITNYNSRTIAQEPGRLPELFPSMLSARLVLMLGYMLLACGWGWLLGYRGWELELLAGILVFQGLNALVAFIRSNISALHKFKTDAILSIADRLLMILICGFLLLYPATAGRFRIQWFVTTQIFCYLATAIAAYVVLVRIARVRLRFAFHGPTVLRIIRDTLPYALLIFQMSIYNRADAMMVERICRDGKTQATIWASAFRLLDMVNMLGLMFATMLLPLYGRMLSQKQDVAGIVKLCMNMLMPLSFVVGVAGIFFSGDIMHLLYNGASGPGSAEYQIVFSWLIASFPSWCMMYVYSTLLTANGSLRILNIVAFAGVVINLSLNFWLIPSFSANGGGAIGAAITSFTTQTVLAFAFMIACTRMVNLPFNLKWVLALVSYLLATCALAWFIHSYLHAGWLVQLALLGVISVAGMFVFRFVSFGALKQLMGKQ